MPNSAATRAKSSCLTRSNLPSASTGETTRAHCFQPCVRDVGSRHFTSQPAQLDRHALLHFSPPLSPPSAHDLDLCRLAPPRPDRLEHPQVGQNGGLRRLCDLPSASAERGSAESGPDGAEVEDCGKAGGRCADVQERAREGGCEAKTRLWRFGASQPLLSVFDLSLSLGMQAATEDEPQEEDNAEDEMPKYYRKVEIKYSRFGIEDFDFGCVAATPLSS